MNYQSLLKELGPFPTLRRVALFLGEPHLATWRRLKSGELESVQGTSLIRISLNSLVRFLKTPEEPKIGRPLLSPIASRQIQQMLAGSQIARHYDVDAATVRRWRREGMPARYFSAKMVRYELSKVDEWLRAKGSQPRPVLIPPHELKKKEAGA